MKGNREKLKEAIKEIFSNENSWLGFLKENHHRMTEEQRLEFLIIDKNDYEANNE